MTVIDILTRVDVICKKYDKYDIDKHNHLSISGDDVFARLYADVESDIEAALQKAETAANGKNRASVVVVNAEIRRTKARLLDQVPKLQSLAFKKHPNSSSFHHKKHQNFQEKFYSLQVYILGDFGAFSSRNSSSFVNSSEEPKTPVYVEDDDFVDRNEEFINLDDDLVDVEDENDENEVENEVENDSDNVEGEEEDEDDNLEDANLYENVDGGEFHI
ncbi:hypothetical protein AgCh_036313 [Apium graveolens]